MAKNDLELVEIPNLEWLANSPRVEQVVIAGNGDPVMMPVPDPRAFAIHKAWLSHQADREPVKKQRDLNQALMVVAILQEHLPHLPINTKDLRYFPKGVLKRALSDLKTNQ
jgi:hypothetical protein